MRIIKMNDDKSLVTTVRAPIYQNENNADTLKFLLPTSYENEDIANCTVLLMYQHSDNLESFEELGFVPELYKGYYQYTLKVDTKLTSIAGRVKIRLNIVNTEDDFVLKSGHTFIDIISMNDSPNIDNGNKNDIIDFDDNITPDTGGDDDSDESPDSIGGEIIYF